MAEELVRIKLAKGAGKTTSVVTRKAFEKVWKPRGFVIVGDTPTESTAKKTTETR